MLTNAMHVSIDGYAELQKHCAPTLSPLTHLAARAWGVVACGRGAAGVAPLSPPLAALTQNVKPFDTERL